jgi:hypothetical protein
MNVLYVFLWIVAAHWISDFVLQSDWMSKNKSKSNTALGCHVIVYALAMIILCVMPMAWAGVTVTAFIFWWLFNWVAHGVTDYFTSRWTSKLWAKGEVHNFFVVVGLDQLIHYWTLGFTLALVTK